MNNDNEMILARRRGAVGRVDTYHDALTKLQVAAADFRGAERALELAREGFANALREVEKQEQLTLPSAQDVRGILND